MSRRILLKVLSLALALGVLTYVLTQPDEVSRAQTSGFDRTQYANDKPIEEPAAQDQLPDTGEFNVMIELFDPPTARVYAEALGNQTAMRCWLA